MRGQALRWHLQAQVLCLMLSAIAAHRSGSVRLDVNVNKDKANNHATLAVHHHSHLLDAATAGGRADEHNRSQSISKTLHTQAHSQQQPELVDTRQALSTSLADVGQHGANATQAFQGNRSSIARSSNGSLEEQGKHAKIAHVHKQDAKETALPRCSDEAAEGLGCRTGCTCSWHHSCFPGHSDADQDFGRCSLSVPLLFAVSILVFLCALSCVVFLRLYFQLAENMEQEIKNLQVDSPIKQAAGNQSPPPQTGLSEAATPQPAAPSATQGTANGLAAAPVAPSGVAAAEPPAQ
eukprot:TRINITY_DN8534_c0_g1_i1.p1 TRINITY_DN8534_c0_g1~~TRINITY_DN8534_c0_g1_i1.p1  ORF type:complete len:294 (+),score=43.96 TRINITY_DN8534_c0_g1_i1:132-1013(+)